MAELGLLTGEEWRKPSGTPIEVIDKYSGDVFAMLAASDAEQADQAISAAVAAFADGRIEPYRRFEILQRAAGLVEARRDELASGIVAEGGFTQKEADGEVGRAVQTLLVSAEEAKRITGELVPIEGAPATRGKLAFTMRVPFGVVAAISPFNSPLNTPLHKIAPAIAAGNSVVLKPATLTPVTAVRICEIFQEAGLPAGWLNLVVGAGSTVGLQLLRDERIGFYHFTGSTEVGRTVRREIGLRGASLELGSIAATIVCEDGDTELAVNQCNAAAFRKAGQICTSTQLIHVHRKHYSQFVDSLGSAAGSLVAGDPRSAETDIGPLISQQAADRVRGMIRQSIDRGAVVVAGGDGNGPVVKATVVTDVRPDQPLVCQEAFGPVVSVMPFDTIDEVIEACNSSPYGLATGAFTNDMRTFSRLAGGIRTGTIHINSTSSSRVDLMPFGGVKDSGNGKEGPHYAIREMTEERLVVVHGLAW